MPADPHGRSDVIEWLFAALNSVEAASLLCIAHHRVRGWAAPVDGRITRYGVVNAQIYSFLKMKRRTTARR